MTLRFRRLGAIALGVLVALAAAPLQATEMTADQRKAIEAIVRETIVNNPEILQEALIELEKRQQQAQKTAQVAALSSEKAALFSSPHHAVVGNPNGDVTLIEFFDYNCGYCKRALTDMTELAKSDPKLRIVLKDFPVLGPDSIEASKAALAARQQLKGDKYFDFHSRLMSSKGRIGKERALAVAKEMGLDAGKLAKDMEAPEVQAAIEEAVRLGDKLGLTGTPSFIVGDEVVSGAVGVNPLRQAIAAVRQCGKAVC